MTTFVNAKINIGLNVTHRREDGYHDLETVFYPVGLYAGSPDNPVSFSDVLELEPAGIGQGVVLRQTGNGMDCKPEDNLVVRAAKEYLRRRGDLVPDLTFYLDKHLPEQAGIGGGSADAAFALRLLADLEADFTGLRPDEGELASMALALGADCPFFLINKPCFATGVGDQLKQIPLDLAGKWLVLVKPRVAVSTKEAFAGIKPHAASFDLRSLPSLPVSEWRGVVVNDFEKSVFRVYPELGELKNKLYASGALYASMTGSGSCIYGIYGSREEAGVALTEFPVGSTIKDTYLLKL